LGHILLMRITGVLPMVPRMFSNRLPMVVLPFFLCLAGGSCREPLSHAGIRQGHPLPGAVERISNIEPVQW
jgi:hypothetical protein